MKKELTKKQKKLPIALQKAILKKANKKNMDKEELKNPEKADLDKDGKLSSYEIKRGKAIEKATKDCSCGCGDTVATCKCDKNCSCKKPGGSCHSESKKEESFKWNGKEIPKFSEWAAWKNSLNEMDFVRGGNEEVSKYGPTGDPSYPYEPEHGPDPYFPATPNNEQINSLFEKARKSLGDVGEYCAAMAKAGDMVPMKALDIFYKTLSSQQARHAAGLMAGKRTPRTN